MRPSAELDLNLSEGVVAEKVLVEQLESEAEHGQEALEEDDAFLGSAAPEVWEYEVVDQRAKDFEDALRNSDLVLEYDVIDTTPTTASEVPASVNAGRSVYPEEGSVPRNDSPQTDVTEAGSGVRAGDDGPAGIATGDPSAGGLNRRRNPLPADEAAEFERSGSGDLEELHVSKANDPRLGITNRGPKHRGDWAADTGPTRKPDRGVETQNPQDRGSTLGPRKGKR